MMELYRFIPGVEQWRPIPGYEGRYEVSDHGQVKSLLHKISFIMKQQTDKWGYRTIKLCPYKRVNQGNGCFVHRLVLLAFVGECPNGMEGSHKNSDTEDNSLSNLLWETQAENAERKRTNGTWGRGRQRVLSQDQVSTVKKMIDQGIKQLDIAAHMNVHPPTISQVKRGLYPA